MNELERALAADAHRQKRRHAQMRPFLAAFDAILAGKPVPFSRPKLPDDQYVVVHAVFMARTNKAVKLDIGKGEVRAIWIPRQCLDIACDYAAKTAAVGDPITARITKRFAVEKGLA